ncbi:hypothetical protein B0H16DRAFT_1683674 [Mycena metata]|uniref:Uncharacterized protein n=1 Tax=Mycena metata TaxID=1033252 RepID=A0AAD7K4X8_9AGAR|nr:hypothetical protein B0H16DRAFT_1683674 [Mycena metata]
MAVGTVAQHLEGTAKELANLSFKTGNRVTLVDLGDIFGCELFFQPSTHPPTTAPSAPSKTVPTVSTSALTGAPAPLTNLSGAGSDLPLEIAQARREIYVPDQSILPKRSQNSTSHFLAFLREFAQQDGGLATERNKTAGQARRSNAQFMPFFNKFKVFSTGTGYHIPASTHLPPIDFIAPSWVTITGWEQYRNCTFTQLLIIEAAERASTSTRTNMSLFKKARQIPGSIGDWVKSPLPPLRDDDDDNDDLKDQSPFESMRLHEFQAAVKEEYAEQFGEKLTKSSKSKSKGSSSKASSSRTTKRRRSRSRDVGSEEDRKRKKREVKRRTTTSEDLDESNDAQSDSDSEPFHSRRRE